VHKDDPAEHFLFTAPDGEVVPAQKLADELSEPSGVFRLVGASVDRLCACVLWIMSHRLANDWFNDSFKELDPEARALQCISTNTLGPECSLARVHTLHLGLWAQCQGAGYGYIH